MGGGRRKIRKKLRKMCLYLESEAHLGPEGPIDTLLNQALGLPGSVQTPI